METSPSGMRYAASSTALTDNTVEIEWGDGHHSEFIWLRLTSTPLCWSGFR